MEELIEELERFAEERDWTQYHSPKNLAMALAVEAAELMEHFQWLTEDQSRTLDDEARQAVAAEVADVFVYLLRLTDKLDIDLLAATRQKMAVNRRKYPADLVRGSAAKYTAYQEE